ncbi:hypothetical protein AN958_06919 [Leucoagaricus sp. SymC.cos]|nr:hypothetical protein AN958_06919 [Leucoagaricus sp. SymC.cos]
MKYSSTRSIPPPIDLSVSGSNLWRTYIPGSKDRDMGSGQHPYAYIIEVDDGTSLGPTSTPPVVVSPRSSTPGPSQVLLPSIPATSKSVGSFLSSSDHIPLVPNRRRRSYSESAYPPDSPSATQRSVSGPVQQDGFFTPKTSEFPDSACSSNSAYSVRNPSPFTIGFKSRLKGPLATDDCPHERRVTSTVGRRGKLWSSITHLPLSVVSREFGHGGDSHILNTPRKKAQRPGTSPSTPSLWGSFIDASIGGGNISQNGNSKKQQRPSTASSVASSPARSPRRGSKLEWSWQWKRLSHLKTSSSISLAPVKTSPSTTVLSSPSPISASSSTSSTLFSPSSPNAPPATPNKPINQSLRLAPSVNNGFKENANLVVLPSPKLRNRSTPNLQAPDLSLEDLGKVNAFYAPPPPAHAVEALNNNPRRRAVSSGPRLKPRLPLPPEIPEPLPKGVTKPLPVPVQTSISTQRMPKGKGIPITLPLSPIGSVKGEWNSEEEIGVIYLTVEDDLDEESGEARLRLVEIPE